MLLTRNFKIFHSNYQKKLTKWTCITCVREKSAAKPNTKTYSNTILFPKTDFPARSSVDKDEIQKRAQFSQLYNWQREHLNGTEFVLHDGPPYANGDLHMGHAVNKIIKDVNNRSKILQGNKVHYIPGWDCHGLPIEFKALQAKKTKDSQSDPVHTRQIARNFALETVEKQKASFESWGIMADWNEQCYLTLNKDYVQNQLRQFYKMYKSGLIYRALKPVYWSPSSRTALAEAELEYDPQFKSKEIYVKFQMENLPEAARNVAGGVHPGIKTEEKADSACDHGWCNLAETSGPKPTSALIWTTTPWTLIANKAIAFNPNMTYCVVMFSTSKELFMIASDQVEELKMVLNCDISMLVNFPGKDLQGCTYKNELTKEVLPFLEAGHVTKGKGTGLIHTAPAHGPDDFLVALRNNMTVECNVDELGRYTDLGPDYDGLQVLTEGQEVIIKNLEDSIVHQGTYIHSYPLDWRTKKPVIVRASHQWFIDTAALKERALEALDKVVILPPVTADQSRQGFRAQLEKRPYWCISRQRAWGVPIPVLYKGSDVIVEDDIIEKLCELINKRDTDVWWTCDVKELIPDSVVEKYDLDTSDVTKGKDIMDIWLDSGLSWQTLSNKKASLYSEGIDQLTGWFQASLLTSLALKGEAPYESIFVHGFVVDDKKRKMSKSIGNVMDPNTIIRGDKKQPAYGVDTLRWWVASHATQHSQIVISKKLLEDCQNEVIRIRSILKYLLGVTSDMEKNDFNHNLDLNYFDQFMVKECHEFSSQINDHYNNFRYNHVAQNILFFISNKVSGLYCHCIKDRLYCSPKNSTERLSAQNVIHTIMISLLKALGPILPHLVEEAWLYHPLYDKPFYFTEDFSILPPNHVDNSIMAAILEIKRDVCIILRNENLKKFSINLKLNSDLYDKLNRLNVSDGVNDSVLCEILEVSAVNVIENCAKNWQIEVAQSNKQQCLRCRKYNATDNSDKCLRCEKAIALLYC